LIWFCAATLMIVFRPGAGNGLLAQPAVINSSSAGYTLTAWTVQTGLPPGDVIAIAEDLDGYLWLGTSSGLVRFDGALFTARTTLGDTAPPEDRVVSALVGSRDGSLWVGHGGSGGVARIHLDQVTNYHERDGLFSGAVVALLEDRTGTIWAGGRGGLSRFRNGRWEPIRNAGDYGGAEVYSIYQDRKGRLWLGTSAGIYAGGTEAFELQFSRPMFVQNFIEDLHDTMWVTDTRETVKQLNGSVSSNHAAAARPPQSGWRLAMDRRGQIWIAALGGGLLRMADSGAGRGAIERFPYEEKIGGAPVALFLDREGDLWVGMRGGGLMRISEQSIAGNVPLDGLTNDGVRVVAAGAGGSVWVATGHSLNRFVGASRESFEVSQTRALSTDHRGVLWVSTAHGLGRVEAGRFVPVQLPSSIVWERVSAVTSDATDGHWLCSSAQGVMVWRHDELFRFDDVPTMRGKACSYLYSDRRGRQWVGFAGGGIAVHSDTSTESYTQADGLAGGGVLAILEDRGGAVWITTRSGVSRFQNGHFTTLTPANGPFTDLVAALVEDDSGYVWIGVNGGAAVVRFLASEMDKVAVDASRLIEYALYDASDGMQGQMQWQQTRAAAARGPDGRLWFATGLGVVIVDPQNLPKSRRPVPPVIEQVVADGRGIPANQPLELRAGVSNLAIHWAAVSLKSASKLRFRYRLEGYEPNWVAGGARRSVSYEHLPSGQYRFRVSATTDGIWTDAASWEFAVAPPFYRSRGFLAFSVLTVAGLIAGASWLRVRTMHARYSLVFAERALVSREIHDTMLQGFAAIGMELEAIARRLDPSQTSSLESLRRLRHQAAHSLGEARDLAVALRQSGMSRVPGLAETLRIFAEHTTTTRGVDVQFTIHGRADMRCSGDVDLQLLRICQEAVNNAIRHGRATEMTITLEFKASGVVLRVGDNGCGFTTGVEPPAADGKDHLGLLGMKERAARVRGHLTITSAPGAGTVIEVVVPVSSR
jgi:signal transduction histidine kinase/ligand-binding sensor domain-containing protein